MVSKIIKYVWLFTALFALFIAVKNYMELKNFSHHVLVPFFLSVFAVYLFLKINKQIKDKNKNN